MTRQLTIAPPAPSATQCAATTVWAIAWESETSGACAWRRNRAEAEILFEEWRARAMMETGESLIFWMATVPPDATNGDITRLVDNQMWMRDYTPLRQLHADAVPA